MLYSSDPLSIYCGSAIVSMLNCQQTRAFSREFFETVIRVAHSGNHGDGKVYIFDVLEGGRISSGERAVDLG